MDKWSMQKYVIAQKEIELPQIQNSLSLSYPQVKAFVEEMIEMRVLEYVSGVKYRVIPFEEKKLFCATKSMDERFFRDALWACIERGGASAEGIAESGACNTATALRAIDWMKEEGYVGDEPDLPLKMTAGEYRILFGDPEQDQLRSLRKRLQLMKQEEESKQKEEDEEEEEDDPDDPVSNFYKDAIAKVFESDEEDENETNDDGDNGDEKDDEEDEDDEDDGEDFPNVFAKMLKQDGDSYKSRIEHLNAFIRERGERKKEADENVDLKQTLMSCMYLGLNRTTDKNKFIFGDKEDDRLDFTFIHDGFDLRISDGGRTLKNSTIAEVAVKAVLSEYEGVALEDGVISIIVANPLNTITSLLRIYSAVQAVKKIR